MTKKELEQGFFEFLKQKLGTDVGNVDSRIRFGDTMSGAMPEAQVQTANSLASSLIEWGGK